MTRRALIAALVVRCCLVCLAAGDAPCARSSLLELYSGLPQRVFREADVRLALERSLDGDLRIPVG